MKELIKITTNEQEQQVVSARELYEGLGVGKKFTSWIKGRIEKYGFEENIDWTLVSQNWETNNPRNSYTIRHDYIITIDMAKELCMVENNELGRKFRKYFIECERKLKEVNTKDKLLLQLFSNDPMTVANAHKQLVELETKPLLEKIENDKPLVAFADRVMNKGENILVRELAKIISDEGYSIGEKRLYKQLREWGYILKHSTEPTQRAIDSGYFVRITRVVNTPYGTKETFTTKVAPKGQIKITERILQENNL